MILLETRVKSNKADGIRNKLHIADNYIDNYNEHENGRIWVGWNANEVSVHKLNSSSQFIHCRVDDCSGVFQFWLTAVYAHNELERRKTLWKDIERIHENTVGPWCVIGDFNNVAKAQDRIGGNIVTEREFVDMQDMMLRTGLSEMDSSRDYFTWFNKHTIGPIHSRIDRLLGNVDWFQKYMDVQLKIMSPSVSDHAMLYVDSIVPKRKPMRQFRFTNCLVDMPGFEDVVRTSWIQRVAGSPMKRLWIKLKRLQTVLRRFSYPLSHLQQNLNKAREDLQKAQGELSLNRMDTNTIERVKFCTEEVIRLNGIEESILQQRSKID
ncbi:uncharacterized protein LOC131659870 [Vicia villosa]|uniref:uncharacterized protein LOC131659870 n=1 Tax=Vicia villosa TaxID=3911 RepID=UPI00273B2596|nr:uncharacterized protein LOC131659870 [Vicia villosa]